MSKVKVNSEIFNDYLEGSVHGGGSYSKDLHAKTLVMDYPQGSVDISIEENKVDDSSITSKHDESVMSFYGDDNQSDN